MTGAMIFEAACRDENLHKLFFDEVLNGQMEAGKPYLFLPQEGVAQLSVFYTDNAAPVAASHYNGFYGYYNLADATEIYHVNVGEYLVYNNQYIKVNGSNSTLAQYRAYIKMEEMTCRSPSYLDGLQRHQHSYRHGRAECF